MYTLSYPTWDVLVEIESSFTVTRQQRVRVSAPDEVVAGADALYLAKMNPCDDVEESHLDGDNLGKVISVEKVEVIQ